MKMFDAPIAGANYAADTRNYPWHRPPTLWITMKVLIT